MYQYLDYSTFGAAQMWKYPFAQVSFQSEPGLKGKCMESQLEEMSQAMIKSVLFTFGVTGVLYILGESGGCGVV